MAGRAGRIFALGALAVALLMLPAAALAHTERSSFWPDPRPDKSIKPAAGGKFPKYRPLATALRKKAPGTTRVVCQDDSLKKARKSINRARKAFKVRPNDKRRKMGKRQARKRKKLNARFAKRCKFDSIQKAVDASGNNDRIVIMPGTYEEPESRAAPTFDPACDHLREDSDHGSGAVPYRYQAACPNDQNLIAVIGRGAKDVPTPVVGPDSNRHGIPDVGKCIRCNLQIEGSGARPHDVVIDAGNGPIAEGPQAGEGKDVGIRADRADGFYLRNVTVQHANEHGVYPIEVDGYALDRVRMLYNHEYGHLSFSSDHGLITNCEAKGSGDAGVYPGAAAQTGEQTSEKKQRYNQVIRRCDIHHNLLGHSGSMGDAIRMVHNNFYDNGIGISVDSISAAGHPGYPQDSTLVEKNRIYSNNFNPYEEGSDVVPTVNAVAIGTGMWIAGGNANIVRENHIYDNWRRGVMLFQVPDAIACDIDRPQQTCSPDQFPEQSNSHRNQFHDNVMGVAPGKKGRKLPNGLDFWWANQTGDKDNCWFDNTGVDGTKGSVTDGIPSPLPSDCSNSLGDGPVFEAELAECLTADRCTWHETPPRPGSAAAKARSHE